MGKQFFHFNHCWVSIMPYSVKTGAGDIIKGSRVDCPKCSIFAYELFWTENKQSPKGSKRAFYLPLNCLKEFSSCPGRELPQKSLQRVWARYGGLGGAGQDLFVPSPPCVLMSIPNICSSHVPVNCLPSLWSPKPLSFFSLAQDCVQVSLKCWTESLSGLFEAPVSIKLNLFFSC